MNLTQDWEFKKTLHKKFSTAYPDRKFKAKYTKYASDRVKDYFDTPFIIQKEFN